MKQKILSIFLFFFALQIVAPVAILADAKPLYFNPEVLIPGMKETDGKPSRITIDNAGEALKEYVAILYKFAIGLTGILATVVFAVGGLIWLTAGGSTTQIGKAKQCILGSITGLVLALSSYVLLGSINPNIVKLHFGESISALDKVEQGCTWLKRPCKIDKYEEETKYGENETGPCGSKPKAGKDPYYCCCILDKEKYMELEGCCEISIGSLAAKRYVCNTKAGEKACQGAVDELRIYGNVAKMESFTPLQMCSLNDGLPHKTSCK